MGAGAPSGPRTAWAPICRCWQAPRPPLDRILVDRRAALARSTLAVGRAMALERLLHEPQRRGLFAGPVDVALENLALLVERTPQVMHLAVDLYVDLVEVPAPLAENLHAAHPLAPHVGGEERAEPVPPHPHGLVANVDPALEQQVLDVAQAQREADVHHHHQADHLGRGVEVAERTGRFAWAGHSAALARRHSRRQSVRLL